ncbi:cupin [Paenibacillus sp. MMS20-IR301]|uniref:cupin n=1 Tax=Paenibacillus sp. MMS20-IR301 TaxID=2895946 RepID=UPI0028E250B4|nr:cupin [Paenibacillus sp. MMS20-IR301]WNS44899.1 cupin [Paenibacillus sp. MMS20-IR301]
MKIYSFSQESGKSISAFDSDFIMSRIVRTGAEAHIGCVYLGQQGMIGYHQAACPQLLLIVQGEGYVRGEEAAFTAVHAGQAVYWELGEWHETRTDTGLTAIIIESDSLNPADRMPLV